MKQRHPLDPPVCDCGHLFSIHPCIDRGAWEAETPELVWIDKFTALQVLRVCQCEVPE